MRIRHKIPFRENKQKSAQWLLDNIAETSKNARKIYLLFLSFLAYCALTIVSITDRQLVLNESARLPIINIDVPINGFFILGPILAIFMFIYFQIYLDELNKLTEKLKSNYPQERKKIYPWFINFSEEIDSGFIKLIKRFIVYVSLWWALPITLSLFPIFYLRKHSTILSYFLSSIPLFSGLLSIIFRDNYYSLKKHKIGNSYIILITSSISMFCLVWTSGLTDPRYVVSDEPLKWRFENVDLSYQILINEENKKYQTLYWADLKKIHLENADLRGSVLKKANLEGAYLDGAFLQGAILHGANLKNAKLQKANLEVTNLDSADLSDANLQGALLRSAKVQGTKFYKANLQEANLSFSNYKKINFYRVNYKGANLSFVNLDSANLSYVNFQDADLTYAKLKSANLSFAKFQGSILKRIDLLGADLKGAYLVNAKNLTISQLSKVKTLYLAEMDSMLLDSIKIIYPELLKDPDLKN